MRLLFRLLMEKLWNIGKFSIHLGRQNCVEAYAAIAEALYQGGIDGFLLETMNYWDEALMALQGVEKFIKKVRIYTSNLMPFL